MTVEITADAVPVIAAKRIDCDRLKIVCLFCRVRKGWKKGQPRCHVHGTGGRPGLWRRLAHCIDADLRKHLLERQRSGQGCLTDRRVERAAPHQGAVAGEQRA